MTRGPNTDYNDFVFERAFIQQEEEHRFPELIAGLEEIALKDEYFQARKLYPNVDFYSGIIYKALGIPTDFFTVMFALGRTPGWVAQWMELHTDAEQRIGRPRQLYTGAATRDYVPVEKR